MPVTLNIGNRDIKMVASQGNAILKWETVPLLPGMVKDGQILQPAAVAGVINSVFNRLKLPRNQVVASISGMSFTYRILTLPGMKPHLQREAIQRATRKEINVSLDELYIDWQIIADTAKEIRVFILGVSRTIIDALIQTMSLAKVKLTAMDIKSLALARATGNANALIVDFEPDWFDVTIISNGIPVTLHTAASRSETASIEDKVHQLVDELNRTVDFFNLTHKNNPILPATPVILTGTLAANTTAKETLLQNIGHPVQSLVSRLKMPPDFAVSPYEVNLGLILKHSHQKAYSEYNVANYYDINLDPLAGRKREITPPVSLHKLLVPAVILIAFLLLIPFSMLRNSSVAETNKLQTELTRINRNLYVGRLALDEANTTAATISTLTAELEKIQQERELISGRGELSVILNLIKERLPTGAEYTSISAGPDQVIVDGKAGSRLDVINYARVLEKQGNFSGVRLALIDESPVTFRIVIER
jgi:type IV pilus assembly protein PilM